MTPESLRAEAGRAFAEAEYQGRPFTLPWDEIGPEQQQAILAGTDAVFVVIQKHIEALPTDWTCYGTYPTAAAFKADVLALFKEHAPETREGA